MRQEAPKIGQEGIRDCFAVGQTVLMRTGRDWVSRPQTVLMRTGRDWVSREILGITVLRNNVSCQRCGTPMLGEPRFWFTDYGNIPLEDIMAKEDIDPTQ